MSKQNISALKIYELKRPGKARQCQAGSSRLSEFAVNTHTNCLCFAQPREFVFHKFRYKVRFVC